MRISKPGGCGALVSIALVLGAGMLEAADSNAVEVRALADSGPRYLTENAVTFPVDWSSGLVPAGATEAVLSVKGNHYDVSATVTKPADAISCTLFDPATGPIYNDSLFVKLDFKVNGVVRAAYETKYQLRLGAFAQDRVLTAPTSSAAWRLCRLPLDLPFDESWFSGRPTYAATSNLVTGLSYKPIKPLNGPDVAFGVLPLTKEKCGTPSRLNVKIWSGNALMGNVDLDAAPGLMILVQ